MARRKTCVVKRRRKEEGKGEEKEDKNRGQTSPAQSSFLDQSEIRY